MVKIFQIYQLKFKKKFSYKILPIINKLFSNLLIKYNKLSNECHFVKRKLQEEQSPYSFMNHYLNMYENKNGIYSNKERYEAYDLLQSQYYPVIKIYKEKILKLKK